MKEKIDEKRLTKAKNLGAKYVIKVEDNLLFLKEPDKPVYKAWYAQYSEDSTAANETAIRSLVIKEVSDMDIFNDANYKLLASCFNELADIMGLKKSTLLIL